MRTALRVLARTVAFAAIFGGTLCAAEGVALVLNARIGAPRPFLVDAGATWAPPEGRRLSFVDPLLGAAYNPDALGGRNERYRHGFFVTGEAADPDALRIVTLGGSTTEEAEGCWPAALHDLLAAAGVKAVVFNGGTSGQCTDQEVLKLVRDGLSLRPDLVVAYDGVNDVIAAEDLPLFPHGGGYAHEMHERLMDLAVNGCPSWLLPNVMALARRGLSPTGVEGIERGVPRALAPAEAWHRNVRVMKAVCDGFGIRFLHVLQPARGVGDRVASAEEDRRVAESGTCRKDYPAFYPDARRIAAASGGLTLDLTDVLDDQPDVYRDYCHIYPRGNAAVARAILAELERRAWLSRPAAGPPSGAPAGTPPAAAP